MTFFSKASYFVILVRFEKANDQSNNLRPRLLRVRISLGVSESNDAGIELIARGFLSLFCMPAFGSETAE